MAKTKLNWKNAAVAVLVGATVVMSTAALVKVSRQETTETIGVSAWKVAGVTTDGKLDKENESHITTDLISADGLKIEVDEDANVKFIVHYYDASKNYLSESKTGELTSDYTSSVEAKYARVELNPITDEDGEVTIFELPGYAALIEITVNK